MGGDRLQRKIAREKDKDEFRRENLEEENWKTAIFLAYEGSDLEGASIIHIFPENENPEIPDGTLNFLVLEDDLREDFSTKLLERSLETCKDNDLNDITLKSTPYSSIYVEFFKERGFERNEKVPTGLLMRKDLGGPSEFEKRDDIKIDLVRDLERSGFLEDIAEIGVYYSPEDLETMKERYRNNKNKDNRLWIIGKKEEEPLGFLVVVFEKMMSGESMVLYDGLIVKEEYRGQGIGKTLLVHSFEEVKERGYEEVYIGTHSENPAQRLYRRLGFEVERKMPNMTYYLDAPKNE